MAHHSDKPLFDDAKKAENNSEVASKISDMIRAIQPRNHLEEKYAQLGATGNFPEGKLSEHDEGELHFAVGVHDGKVVLEFGKSVRWFGMTVNQARELADLLIEKATEAIG